MRVPSQLDGAQVPQQRRVGPAGGADVARPLGGVGCVGWSAAGVPRNGGFCCVSSLVTELVLTAVS